MKTAALILFLVSVSLAGEAPEPPVQIMDFELSSIKTEVYDETHLIVALVCEHDDTLCTAIFLVDESIIKLYKTAKFAEDVVEKASQLEQLLIGLEEAVRKDDK